MALKRRVLVGPSPEREELRRRLVEEWRNPHDDDTEPIIIEEDGGHRPIHLYVIWQDWADLSQLERSEIIMDAFEEVRGQDEALNVSVAMGLTEREAKRMGIEYE